MTMQQEEADWLERLVAWTEQCDQLVASLETRSDKVPGANIDRNAWQLRFRELGEMADAYREQLLQDAETADAADEMGSLNTKAHQLKSEFVQLMKENSSGEFSEDSELDADDEERKSTTTVPIGEHTLPPLAYDYNALEPHISEEIMRLHHDKHHQGYVDGLNNAEKEMQKARRNSDFSLIRHWEDEAAFNGAGHYLHTIFWENMSPNGGGKPDGAIAKEIKRTFGDFNQFKEHFSKAAENVQAVGWALLVWSPRSHRTEILQAEKHQNLTQQDVIPLLVLDVWEHAYYLQYHNNRKDYIDAWWNVVCWDSVNRRFNEAIKVKWEPY
ncbi:superoxide dismutase [Lentibacillus amyloliquefaciens]|uniref:superoxide dismutase n=1 Tax=Lentibacillus amyloliquefaciens TaxID=1472767 RepID=A0A0U4DW94_9BACI|nr:superoxide dismutase [Lentibacillus amyloliquefaciens]ALX49640.1 superoxide dismutase [Lentibacillus amyloliquefaciens]